MSDSLWRRGVRVGLGASALAGLLSVGLAVPAHADQLFIPDGRDTRALEELVSVKVVHRGMVKVVMKFTSNFHREGEFPFSIYYDTRPGDRGPEFQFVSHFGGVLHRETWSRGGDHIIECRVEGGDNLRRHTITISVGHRCLGGDDGPVGINVVASGKGAHGFVPDHAPGFHEFSAPVARG